MQIIIIGGGASGFMAAITAAETFPGSEIIILEKNKTVLNKVRISGGGRCNVTHQPSDVRFFVKNYPRGEKLLRKLLHQFGPNDTIQWFEKRGVALKVEADGRMFPTSDSSHTIIECLLRTAKNLGIMIQTGRGVASFAAPNKDQNQFHILLENGETLTSDRLVIATGGYPKLASFDWIGTHEHHIVPPNPSLFTFNTPENYLLPLAGVSVQDVLVKISATKHEWRGPILITHWGFSGPAVLKLSAWGARELADNNYHFSCRINWVPSLNEQQLREYLIGEKTKTPKQQIASHPKFGIPSRLWKAFTERAEIPDGQIWSEVSHKLLNRLSDLLNNSQFDVKGKTTFKEEFVTCGGVALSEMDAETLESKKIAGLFFAGEVIDVDGITGGFNFQNAWTTGYTVGKSVGR